MLCKVPLEGRHFGYCFCKGVLGIVLPLKRGRRTRPQGPRCLEHGVCSKNDLVAFLCKGIDLVCVVQSGNS